MRQALYAEFYGFSEEPFNVTPDPKFLFLDETYREGLAHLEYGVHYGKGFVLLTGEIGTGKTTLLNALLDRLPKEFTTALIFSTTMSFVELLKMIHEDFGTGCTADSEAALMIELNKFLIREYDKGKSSVLILDEAQNIDIALLEKIRLLSNLEGRKSKLLQILLSGQPELLDKLDDPALRQLKQRIAIRYALVPLSRSATNHYVDHRLSVAESRGRVSFTDEAIDVIYEHSQGIPRLVNILCGNALLLGFGAGKRKIDAGIIREVIADLTRVTPRLYPPLAAGAGEAAGAGHDAGAARAGEIAATHRGAVVPIGLAGPEGASEWGHPLGPSRAGDPPWVAARGLAPHSGGERPWTAGEAAAYLRVATSTVLRLFRSGEIGARRIGRSWRVHRAELDRFIRGGAAPGRHTGLDRGGAGADAEGFGEDEGSGP